MKEICFYYFPSYPTNWFVYSCIYTITYLILLLIECLDTYRESKYSLMLKKHIVFLFLNMSLGVSTELHHRSLKHLTEMITFF